jgi:hypothetical protein
MAQQTLNNGETGLVIRGKINDNFTELYGTDFKVEWFEEIGSGTAGTLTKPTGSTILLNEWGGGVDALASTSAGGGDLPLFETPVTAGGAAITATLDTGGNWTLSGTPSSYPVDLIFVYSVPIEFYDESLSLVTTEFGGKQEDVVTTKGDLVVGDTSGDAARLGIGSNDQHLVADSTQGSGMKWATSGAGIGDMLKSVYDPTTIEGDAFDMDNMVEGTSLILTAGERTILGNTSNTNSGDQTSIVGISGTVAQFNTAISDATLSGNNTGDEVVAIGTELDTGTDDAKFASAKAIKDSKNVPSVVPGSSGNILESDGTDWISAAPSGGGDVSAAAVMADNSLIRGDGGSKGVQDSLIVISDTDEVSGGHSLVVEKSDDYTLLSTDSGRSFPQTGAAKSFSLPADTSGFTKGWFVTLYAPVGGVVTVNQLATADATILSDGDLLDIKAKGGAVLELVDDTVAAFVFRLSGALG